MKTYLIKKSDVEKALTMADCVRVTEEAFRLYGQDKTQMPPKSYLYFEDYFGDLRCMPAYIRDIGAAGIKAVNVHPDNRNANLPTVMATILLIDPKTGFPLAIMDGTHITNMRTGAAGGIAAKYLAKENSTKAAFIGAGIQAETQVMALNVTKPEIKTISIFDINQDAANNFAKFCADNFGMDATVAASIHDACAGADVINCTTSSRKPIVMKDDVTPGAHINAIGADAKGKQEVDPAVLSNAKVVIDDWVQASHSGEINLPVSQGKLSEKDIAGELPKVVAGNLKLRTSDNDITIFDSTGLAIQDLMSAAHVYKLVTEGPDKDKLQTIEIFG
ncbi:MAG: ornithine cyclodeaminase family protein [candidate division Zixibacteria bacterium]|nr:ornithine cyclodeaminase family protein [candidate division Zixibacteria bacterium]